MKTYRIFDIHNGLGANNAVVEAKSPKHALESLGYTDIKRDYTNTGNIVVHINNYSMVYFAKRIKNKEC